MDKILFIAYQFPPRGGPGVHRSLNFVKYLRNFGYEPIVLTVNEDDIKKAGYLYDESLLSEIPHGIRIIRTPSFEPTALIKFLMSIRLYRFVWFIFYRFFWEWSVPWSSKIYQTAKKIVLEENIKLVYTSSSPFSVFYLGAKLKNNLGVKWVADLRDPFTDAYAWQFPSKLHWLLMRKFERKYFTIPDKLIVNTPEVMELYLKRKITSPEKITCLTNGF